MGKFQQIRAKTKHIFNQQLKFEGGAFSRGGMAMRRRKKLGKAENILNKSSSFILLRRGE